MNAFFKFNKGMLKSPLKVQLWLMVLVTANLIVPLVYIHRLEAQVVIGTMMASMILMTALTARFGFTRILGLGHILWVPLLGFLATRLSVVPVGDPYGIWFRTVMALNAISLVIDLIDVYRYLGGDRAETVAGL